MLSAWGVLSVILDKITGILEFCPAIRHMQINEYLTQSLFQTPHLAIYCLKYLESRSKGRHRLTLINSFSNHPGASDEFIISGETSRAGRKGSIGTYLT
jgi:hypothetical protein